MSRAEGQSDPQRAGRVAVVVNGNAKRVDREVISTLDRILSGGDLFVSRSIDDAADIARTLVDRGYHTVLTGGGDGTFTVMVTEVIREARRQARPAPRFGLLKLGTGNALAWVVGAGSAGGVAADVRRLHDDTGSRPLRLVEVDDTFAPFAGLGVDAEVLQDYAAVKGRLLRTPLASVAPGALSYAVAAVTRSIPSYLFRRMPHLRVVNTGGPAHRIGARGALVGRAILPGEVIYEGRARVATCSTIPYFGFGFRFFPFAEERADRMHLRISTITSADFVRHFPAIWRGEFDDPGVLFDYLVESVKITADPPTPFQIGGDAQGARGEVALRLSPEPIRLVDFYAPPRSE